MTDLVNQGYGSECTTEPREELEQEKKCLVH